MKLKNLLKARDIISELGDIVMEKIEQYNEKSEEHKELWQIWCKLIKLYNITQTFINEIIYEKGD